MCVKEKKTGGKVIIEGVEVDEFKGSAIQINKQCTREVRKKVQAVSCGCRRGLICDRKIAENED